MDAVLSVSGTHWWHLGCSCQWSSMLCDLHSVILLAAFYDPGTTFSMGALYCYESWDWTVYLSYLDTIFVHNKAYGQVLWYTVSIRIFLTFILTLINITADSRFALTLDGLDLDLVFRTFKVIWNTWHALAGGCVRAALAWWCLATHQQGVWWASRSKYHIAFCLVTAVLFSWRNCKDTTDVMMITTELQI